MQTLGLSASDFKKYVAHLQSPSMGVTIQARLLDLAGNLRESMHGVVAGTVAIDTTQVGQPVRSATVVLSDPNHTMAWDSDSPGLGAATINNQIRLEHVTYVPALGRQVVCPLMTGPVSPDKGFSRSGTQVTVNIDGRETLMLGQALRPRSYTKGARRTDVLKDLLWFYGGSPTGLIPDLPARLPDPLSVGRTTVPWQVAQQLAKSLNRQLFFDAAGNAVLRPIPSHATYVIREGDNGPYTSDVTGEAQVNWGMPSGWYNTVEVIGASANIRAIAYPPPSNQLHPQNMGANGAWNVRLHQEANATIRTVSEAQARANTLMNDMLISSAQVTAITKCFPFLEEDDVVRFQLSSADTNQRLSKMAVDLAGTGMSLGYLQRFHKLAAPRKGRR